ncbi:HRDC domain-containing protein [Larkinella arboricola]|uniref:HRDC domain-containing protein n=1 Tax=Larkinella arboricola TaxID=643671 RepID=A0A327X200_LARAB|nr:helix-turn-helix domain-containing protein [Larkinella arboricola]RAK00396.1 HRDC domain-containing protein [Larkinella arboricola]
MPAIVNEKLQLAHDFILHTNRNVFLTGKAGTGKTTFLHQVKHASSKRLAVVAPTGVAAINAGGVTIHSLFQLPFGPLVPGALNRETRKFTREKINLLRTLDLLIVDEISMVRADVLDGIDAVLRRFRNRPEPFGGVQLLLIGDMQQLPPVIRDEDWALLRPYYDTGYFFGSRALQKTPYISIELDHIYRQADQRFIEILNSVREKRITRAQLDDLNQRYIPNFTPRDDEGYITLSTHNQAALQLNSQKLQSLRTKLHTFEATIEGEFPAHAYPTEASLELKVGAQVMFNKNDLSRDKLFYNGKIGQITDIDDDVIYVKCPNDPDTLAVSPMEWTNVRYTLDQQTNEIREEPIGKFVQYPLKLAWAITIHKSQGLTFEKAIIDAASAFAHGQVYVALSRCKTLEGLVLREPIPSHSIKTELLLEEFHEQVQQQTPDEQELWHSKQTNQEQLLLDLFSFERSYYLLNKCRRTVAEHLGSLDEGLEPGLNQLNTVFKEKAHEVTERFRQQLPRYFAGSLLPEENQPLQDRVRKAGAYFRDLITHELQPLLASCPTETDNKQVHEALDELEKELFIKLQCFEATLDGFQALAYQKTRNHAELNFQSSRKKESRKSDEARTSSEKPRTLYDALAKWRQDQAGELDTGAHTILPRKTLAELARSKPSTLEELMQIKGLGKMKARLIGDDLLAIIRSFTENESAEKTAATGEKTAKTPSPALSLALFRSGKTIADIALERNITVSTVEGHLAKFVSSGQLSVYDVIPAEKVEAIRTYLEKHTPKTLTETKAGLGDDVTFSEIRMVYNSLLAGKTGTD